MKKLILVYIFGVTSLLGYTQTNNQNLQKYWQYRYWLKNYYMVVGPDAGMSLPAHHRMHEQSRINWSENPIIELGHYIGVLSTEYKLLKDNNQNTDETIRELYYALYAFNRADMAGDYLWGGTCMPADACALNGFFVRGDVPARYRPTHFLNDHPELNYGLDPIDDKFAYYTNQKLNRLYYVPDYYTTSEKTIQDHETHDPGDLGVLLDPNNLTKQIGLELSADEILGLLEGLSLLAKCVPTGVNYNNAAFQDGETDLLKEAQNITTRVMDWITQTDDWMIVRPNGDMANTRVKGLQNPTFKRYSYPLNIIAANILGVSPGETDYHDKLKLVWTEEWQARQVLGDVLGFCAFAGICNEFALKFILQLATMSNGWHIAGANTTFLAVNDQASYFNWNTYYSLYHHVLHGGNSTAINSLESNVLGQLNGAPCGIPNSDASGNWASKYRWGATLGEQYFEGPEDDGFGEEDRNQGNGLDYMLLHNLYYLTYGNELPQYQNVMDVQFEVDFPVNISGFSSVGSMDNPHTVGAFNTITAYNTIKAVAGSTSETGNVTYRAGREITLKPGFKVEAGAKFHAYIDDYECGGGLYRNADPAGVYGMDMIETKNNFVPIVHTNSNDGLIEAIETEQAATVTPTTEEKDFTNQLEQAKHNEFTIYPNPTRDEFTIFNGSIKGNWRVTIMDIRSRQVAHYFSNNETLDIKTNAWDKGVYFVEIIEGENRQIERLIVN